MSKKPHVEQERLILPEHELLTLPVHLSALPVFDCVCVCYFLPFLLSIALSVIALTASEYPFGIFKLSF